MRNILHFLSRSEQLNIVVFSDRVILDVPIEQWPPCNALIAYHSGNFPTRKVQQYADMHKPAVLNSLHTEARACFDSFSGIVTDCRS